MKQALHVARTWLEAQRAYEQIPGVSAAIVHDQQVLWSGGFGKADLASGREATSETLYSVCSISKDSSGFAGETAVFAWEDGLGMLSLPTMEPVKGMAKLKKTGEHTFRRVRKDEKLGEEVAFEIGPDGRATRFRFHSNYQRRVQ